MARSTFLYAAYMYLVGEAAKKVSEKFLLAVKVQLPSSVKLANTCSLIAARSAVFYITDHSNGPSPRLERKGLIALEKVAQLEMLVPSTITIRRGSLALSSARLKHLKKIAKDAAGGNAAAMSQFF